MNSSVLVLSGSAGYLHKTDQVHEPWRKLSCRSEVTIPVVVVEPVVVMAVFCAADVS